MRYVIIGIDLDDTITNSFEDLMIHFANFFNLNLDYCKSNNYLYNNFPENLQYRKKEFINYLQKNKLLKDITIKKNAAETINKLHNLGCKIIIITSRNDNILPNAYEITKEYLESNNIIFDKLYCEHDKHNVLIEENVKLFIDDSIKGLEYNKDACEYHLLFSSKLNLNEKTKFKRVNSWEEVEKEVIDILN